MVRLIEGLGTPESSWQAWGGLAALDIFDLHPLPASAVVVAPHPDDEVLGVGGTLALLHTAGVTVRVVAVSDGAASHPHSPTVTASQLAEIRRAEQNVALGRLGLDGIQIHRCGLPDGHLDRYEADLADTLTGLLDEHTWCLATWARDGHPDHDATGRSAATAASHTGARLLSFPVWTWHWAQPADPRVPWSTARRVPLPPVIADAKRHAVHAFASQIEPLSAQPGDETILGPHVLARLTRDYEVILL
ncbi:MAG: GlcNAc-PI de-N-acetylase [Pseudonocardiales bacterium]|nr:MAG: GlcNAc-PI de-N-acetylase [Pseudonocardiales bacterium]